MKICVEKRNDKNEATLEMEGSGVEMLSGLALICIGLHERYHVNIATLCAMLPQIIDEETMGIVQRSMIDIGEIEKAKEGSA